MTAEQPPTTDKFQILYAMMQRILREISELKTDLDAIDRTLRPYGDGSRETRRR